MINSLPENGVDASRSILKIGGTEIDFTDWDTSHSGIMEAGHFRASINAPFADWPWWAQQTEILVDVYAGTPKDPLNYTTDDLTMIMTARCDSIELDPETNRITISGRDMTSLLIDNKTTDKWQNLTSSQIAQQIAVKWGMESNITATTQTVGTFYTADHVVLAKSDTYWNILTYLAQRESTASNPFMCFVLGKTLYFGNFAAKYSNDPYVITFDGSGNVPVANASQLRFTRDLTLAQDISVTVRSYHGNLAAAFSATATASKQGRHIEKTAGLVQTTQHYEFTVPGLTQPQCALKAQSILAELSKHELKMSANLPFDAVLYPWVPIQVTGTNTPWDATYTPQTISRRFSKDRVSMQVGAKTGIPQQKVSLS